MKIKTQERPELNEKEIELLQAALLIDGLHEPGSKPYWMMPYGDFGFSEDDLKGEDYLDDDDYLNDDDDLDDDFYTDDDDIIYNIGEKQSDWYCASS